MVASGSSADVFERTRLNRWINAREESNNRYPAVLLRGRFGLSIGAKKNLRRFYSRVKIS